MGSKGTGVLVRRDTGRRHGSVSSAAPFGRWLALVPVTSPLSRGDTSRASRVWSRARGAQSNQTASAPVLQSAAPRNASRARRLTGPGAALHLAPPLSSPRRAGALAPSARFCARSAVFSSPRPSIPDKACAPHSVMLLPAASRLLDSASLSLFPSPPPALLTTTYRARPAPSPSSTHPHTCAPSTPPRCSSTSRPT